MKLLGAHIEQDAYLVLEPMLTTLSSALQDSEHSSKLIWQQRCLTSCQTAFTLHQYVDSLLKQPSESMCVFQRDVDVCNAGDSLLLLTLPLAWPGSMIRVSQGECSTDLNQSPLSLC